MATHSSILAWRIPWTEEPGGLWPIRSQSDTTVGTEHTCGPYLGQWARHSFRYFIYIYLNWVLRTTPCRRYILLLSVFRDGTEAKVTSQGHITNERCDSKFKHKLPAPLYSETDFFPFNVVLWIFIHTCMCAKSLQSCLNLCDPTDCSPPSSSVHGIVQARILEQVAISFSRGSFQPRNQTCISFIGRQILYHPLSRQESPYARVNNNKMQFVIKHKKGQPQYW